MFIPFPATWREGDLAAGTCPSVSPGLLRRFNALNLLKYPHDKCFDKVRCGICLVPRSTRHEQIRDLDGCNATGSPCVLLSRRCSLQVSCSNQRHWQHIPSRHPAPWLSLTNMQATRAVCQSSGKYKCIFSSVEQQGLVRRVALQLVAYPDGVATAARLAGPGLQWIFVLVDGDIESMPASI